METKKEIPEIRYKCPVVENDVQCPFIARTFEELEQHVENVHGKLDLDIMLQKVIKKMVKQ
jgi:hypothetical protein